MHDRLQYTASLDSVQFLWPFMGSGGSKQWCAEIKTFKNGGRIQMRSEHQDIVHSFSTL